MRYQKRSYSSYIFSCNFVNYFILFRERLRAAKWNPKKNIAWQHSFSVHQLSKNNGYRYTPEATVGDVCLRMCVYVFCDLMWVYV